MKPTATSLGPQAEAKRLNRRSDAEAERDPESDNGDVGSEGSSSKGDKGRHALDRLAAGPLQNCVCFYFQWSLVLKLLISNIMLR